MTRFGDKIHFWLVQNSPGYDPEPVPPSNADLNGTKPNSRPGACYTIASKYSAIYWLSGELTSINRFK